MTDRLDLAAIAQRHARATPGPWEWGKIYGLGDGRTCWGLHNPERPDGGVGDGLSRITNIHLLLRTQRTHDYDDVPLEQTPDFEFIAHSWADQRDLLAEVRRLHSERDRLLDALLAAQVVIGQCDCTMAELPDEDPKRLWRIARDVARATLAGEALEETR